MIKKFSLFLALFLGFTITQCDETKQHVYQQELKAFQSMPQYKTVFDEGAHGGLRTLQADVENYKELSFLQRLARYPVSLFSPIVVTSATMPKLYGFIDDLCKKQGIAKPTVYLTFDEGFFNAFAFKILKSTGAILIGKKLLLETSDQELEAIIAHEIGHIKYNHVNKTLLIKAGSYAAAVYIADDLMGKILPSLCKEHSPMQYALVKTMLILDMVNIFSALIINKRFEKQADEFAYKEVNHGPGLIEFFEHLEQKEKTCDDDFVNTHLLIKENKPKIATFDYYSLLARYYVSKGFHQLNKASEWVYHNTFLGAHPSNEARIEAIKKHLQQA